MFVQHCFHLLEALRVLLLKDLVSEAANSMWPGMFQAKAGSGNTVSVRSTRDAISLFIASYHLNVVWVGADYPRRVQKLSPPSLPESTLRDPSTISRRMRHMPHIQTRE